MENRAWNWHSLAKLETLIIRTFTVVKTELYHCLKVVDDMSANYWNRKIANIIRTDLPGSNEYSWVIFTVSCIRLVVNKFLWTRSAKCLWINNDHRLSQQQIMANCASLFLRVEFLSKYFHRKVDETKLEYPCFCPWFVLADPALQRRHISFPEWKIP